MANQEHIDILMQGFPVWNEWRKTNSPMQPDLSDADLSRANLSRADLSRADLSRVNLNKANLSWLNLSRANLSRANLSGADLRMADLNWTNLHRANLSDADLREVRLSNADLSRADLSRADLNKANLNGANLNGANLNGANLRDADLSRAILRAANLSETNFDSANIGWTVFGDTDLSVVEGLESVTHRGPSTIGIDTIYRSGGKIPELFLRGAGVPDEFITYMASLVGKPIDFYSCFISYSSKDEAFAKRLHSALQSEGVRCWFAPEDLKIGSKIWDTIEGSIKVYDKLIIILSQHSIISKWVEREVEAAFEEERNRKAQHREDETVLFPIRLDEEVMKTTKAWAADIRRTRHVGDFRHWKQHDAYQQAFERLLRDLRAEGRKADYDRGR